MNAPVNFDRMLAEVRRIDRESREAVATFMSASKAAREEINRVLSAKDARDV